MSNNVYQKNIPGNTGQYPGNNNQNYNDEQKNKQYKLDVHRDRDIDQYPVDSNMFMPDQKFQNKGGFGEIRAVCKA